MDQWIDGLSFDHDAVCQLIQFREDDINIIEKVFLHISLHVDMADIYGKFGLLDIIIENLHLRPEVLEYRMASLLFI